MKDNVVVCYVEIPIFSLLTLLQVLQTFVNAMKVIVLQV